MTAARRTLLEDVNAWALTLLRPAETPRPAVVPAVTEPGPAEDMGPLAVLTLLHGPTREPHLQTVRRGRVTHLLETWTTRARCGAQLVGPLADAPGARITCPGCVLPPEAD